MREIAWKFVAGIHLIFAVCILTKLIQMEDQPAPETAAVTTPLVVTVEGPGVIKFATTSKGTIAFDDKVLTPVDGEIYRVDYADGSFMYTDQPTFTIEKQATISLDKGDFSFFPESHGVIDFGGGESTELNGKAWACVHADKLVCMFGDGYFEAHNMASITLGRNTAGDDCKLLAVNCKSVYYMDKRFDERQTGKALFLYYDDTNKSVVPCKAS